jgi:SAM-dependent methyltransferase
MATSAPTLRLELFVPGLGPEPAFDQLVSELETTLPRIGYRLEPGPNGRVLEVVPPCEEKEFARVTDWEPGQRIAFSWHPTYMGANTGSVPVVYRFEAFNSGTKITIEYGEWDPSTPLGEGAERVGWFSSEVLPPMIRATAPLGFGDWWTDRVARRPSGASSRKNYADPLHHRPNFLLILDRLHLTASDRLLEVGCGGGAFLHDALASGCRAWAIDHSPDMVRLAQEKNRDAIQEHRVEIVEGDAHRLPFASASCTCAVTTGSFGFWDRPVEGLAEIRRVLEPGGRFILFTGTKELRGTPAAPEPIASRVRWYEDDELADLARAAGFVDVRVDRPDQGPYARKAGLPPDVVAFFESGISAGQVLEARRPPY